ncbi:hypothetical protein GCM10011369_00710 [Neiella marina]|uniref:EAL domain-containing protein n=1 Tax=Neiella marina TaxID=508461 RepID=A0A8J2U1K0_9GAMM|nr:diguanylate cyclase [Neiella marina]GGA63269.1 hypothetical protein GCM10011369_00710 [Neiella marina]
MSIRYKPPFVSLRWQVATVLIVSSAIAVLALMLWSASESKQELNRRILLEQQHLIAELRNTSKQGFHILEERARQLEAVLPLVPSEQSLEHLADSFNATIIDSSGSLLAGPAPPADSKAQQWQQALLANGGEYRRWHCQQQCELQYFSVHDSEAAKLTIQRIGINDLMEKLDIAHSANLWLVAPEGESLQLFYQTAAIPPQFTASKGNPPLPPEFVLVGKHRPQAMWRWPLQNDGTPAELWVAMPTQQSITDVEQVWLKTTTYIVVTLTICCAMAIGLIWRPLLRLSRQARQLPLLATANQSIRSPRHRFLRDESHLFATASQELAEKLKAQRQRLLQQTHELKRLVQHDQLTGLNNRSMFEQSLQQTLGQLGRHIQSLAIMFMDLNKFKVINDTMGHDHGDRLLQQVAMRLAGAIRKSDVLARFGGDEFVILLPEPGGQHQLQLLADKLIDSVVEPIQLSSTTVQVGLSIGITTCHDPQCSISQLLREADTAMYAAKHSGSSCARFFHSSLDSEERQLQQLDNAIAEAIKDNQLQLHYQPIVELADDNIGHYQALVTWPAAPEAIRKGHDLIQQISDPKLQQQASEWLLRQVLDTLDRVTINQMPVRVFIRAADCNPELLRQLVLCCRRDASVANRLGLLIDEQDYIDQFIHTQMELSVLYQAGVAIGLDGFGNSLGALNQLSQMPPKLVRLDGKFCNGVSLQNGFTQSLILMLHKLNIQVVASDVETLEQRRQLQQLHCDFGQGPLLAQLLSEHKLVSNHTTSSHH